MVDLKLEPAAECLFWVFVIFSLSAKLNHSVVHTGVESRGVELKYE